MQWPTINGEKFNTLPFGPTHWCHPIVTMHHMNSEEISLFYEWEAMRYSTPSSQPLLMKEIYHHFVEEKILAEAKRDDWDNLADDWFYLNHTDPGHEKWALEKAKKDDDYHWDSETTAWVDYDHCKQACSDHVDCFSFRFHDARCGMSRAWKLGKPLKKADKERHRSYAGWDHEKIRNWVREQGDCKKPIWPTIKP